MIEVPVRETQFPDGTMQLAHPTNQQWGLRWHPKEELFILERFFQPWYWWRVRVECDPQADHWFTASTVFLPPVSDRDEVYYSEELVASEKAEASLAAEWMNKVIQQYGPENRVTSHTTSIGGYSTRIEPCAATHVNITGIGSPGIRFTNLECYEVTKTLTNLESYEVTMTRAYNTDLWDFSPAANYMPGWAEAVYGYANMRYRVNG